MDRRSAVDPHAATYADERAPAGAVRPAGKPVDSRADTIPSDGAVTVPAPAVTMGLRDAQARPLPQTPAPPVDPLLGRMLGHFRVDALIGHGGMGAVYRAWDTSLLRPVALKVLLADSVTARTRFLREARSQAQLRHPNVVPIHYVGESEGVVFLVMDLVEGESLTDAIRREGRIAEGRALDIVDSVASALSAGHQAGLIHRDVKPSNILLEPSGRALLADFGLAKDIATPEPAPAEPDGPAPSLRSGALTRAGAIVGTPAYLAPEQAEGGHVDHRADMYALGASLFEALTGAPPFDAPTPTAIAERRRTEVVRSPRAIVGDLHPSIEKLVLRLLEKSPDARFTSYDELRAAIARARAPELEPAPIMARAIAFAVDYLIFGIIGSLLAGGLFVANIRVPPVPWLIAVLAGALVEWRLAGASLGKRLMRMRTVDRYGLPPTFAAVAVRSFLKVAGPAFAWLAMSVLPPAPGAVVALVAGLVWFSGFTLALGEKSLALHDRLARTRVVFGAAPPRTSSERGR